MKVVASARSLDQKLSWLPLSPDEIRRRVSYYSRSRGDEKVWNIDGRLADVFDEIHDQFGMQYDSDEFSRALRDRNFTKHCYSQSATLANLDHFEDPAVDRPDGRHYRSYQAARAILVHSLSRIGRLTPIKVDSLEDCRKALSKETTSAGFVGIGSKGDNLETIHKVARVLKTRIAQGRSFDTWIPAVIFHRSQISNYLVDGHYNPDYESKHRMVLCIDGGTIVVEAQYAKPLYKACFSEWHSYSGGDDPETLRAKIRRAKESGKCWYSVDFSKFDQTVPAWLISDMFDVIKDFFPSECRSEIGWIANNFIHTKILRPDTKEVVEKHRGVASGSYFTQVIDTMCNMMMLLTYLCKRHGGSIDEMTYYVEKELTDDGPMSLFALGDDALLFVRQPIDVKDLSSYVGKVFGVKIHPEKTVTWKDQSDPHYLKRDWQSGGEWRDPLDLVITLTHPERWRKYDGYGPWHIVFGLYLTYRCAFPNQLTSQYILERMHADGGIDALSSLDFSDLPGPLRGYGDTRRGELYLHAKALSGLTT